MWIQAWEFHPSRARGQSPGTAAQVGPEFPILQTAQTHLGMPLSHLLWVIPPNPSSSGTLGFNRTCSFQECSQQGNLNHLPKRMVLGPLGDLTKSED